MCDVVCILGDDRQQQCGALEGRPCLANSDAITMAQVQTELFFLRLFQMPFLQVVHPQSWQVDCELKSIILSFRVKTKTKTDVLVKFLLF